MKTNTKFNLLDITNTSEFSFPYLQGDAEIQFYNYCFTICNAILLHQQELILATTQEIIDFLCGYVKIPSLPVSMNNELGFIGNRIISGLYTESNQVSSQCDIKVSVKTKSDRFDSPESIIRTIVHEFMHHYDSHMGKIDNFHNDAFYVRINTILTSKAINVIKAFCNQIKQTPEYHQVVLRSNQERIQKKAEKKAETLARKKQIQEENKKTRDHKKAEFHTMSRANKQLFEANRNAKQQKK